MTEVDKSKKKKDHILEIAKNIAHEEGLSNLNIRRIAKEAGVAIGSVYNIVGNKDDLILYLVKDYWEESIRELDQESKNFDGNYEDKLNQLYIGFRQVSRKFHSDWIRDLVGMHMENPHVVDLSDSYKKEIEDMIKSILSEDMSIKNHFDDDFKLDDLAKFIFDNMMFSMGNNEKNLGFLNNILRRCLKNESNNGDRI